MSNYVVLGLSYGDEGKGQVVSNLIKSLNKKDPSLSNMVVRFSGGHQVGHTVEYNGIRHVFSNFGSGSLQRTPTYWGSNCTVDIVGMKKEFELLKSKNITPKIYINSRCPLVTPFDKVHNLMDNSAMKIGTTGLGFGATKKREEDLYSLIVLDMQDSYVFRTRLKLIRQYYNNESFVKDDDYIEFLEAYDWFRLEPNVVVVNEMPSVDNYIFEGSQGLMLDKNIGFFPHVTRDNTDITNLRSEEYKKIGLSGLHLHFVTRAYSTRHGSGPFKYYSNLKILDNFEETNKLNATQGEFKRSMLDLDTILYALKKFYLYNKIIGYNITIDVTCTDHLEEFNLIYNGSWIKCDSKNSFFNYIKHGIKSISYADFFVEHNNEKVLIF